MHVRAATAEDVPAVLTVLDGALLQVNLGDLRRAVDDEGVLVAVSPAGTVLGALVLDGSEITAIAVRRRRRDQGIGSALVAAAAARRDSLRVSFDRRVDPFWRSVGFEVEPLPAADRLRGRRETDGER
jgi:GNAT superfamily N-acetyltransferase